MYNTLAITGHFLTLLLFLSLSLMLPDIILLFLYLFLDLFIILLLERKPHEGRNFLSFTILDPQDLEKYLENMSLHNVD